MNSPAKTFLLYRSSAGSGKTRTLAREYLRFALKFKADYFKYILAVTFTNKASQEMKDRILAYLSDFSNGTPNELAQDLQQALGFDEQTFRQHSQDVLSEILHHYGHFSISTIDAFFQKVIRSFTREAGLVGDYRLEVDHDLILEQVIDNLIDELGTNKELTDWVVEFARDNLENDKAWDVRFNLIEFAREIFREEFKVIEDDVLAQTRTPGFFKQLMNTLRTRKYGYVEAISRMGREGVDIIQANKLAPEDFKYAGGGAYYFFIKASAIQNVRDFGEAAIGKRPLAEYQDPANWPAKNTPHSKLILDLARNRLVPLMNRMLDYWKKDFQECLAAELVLGNFYSFGLVTDVARKLKEFKDENNIMLLADAPKFLNGVISDSDTPFIYEKVGSFYRNYLIDEFQDTSGMQWKNFQPLITNGLDQGHASMVVGDVKQAIYRWRGGDLSLLQRKIIAEVGAHRTEVRELSNNYRSSRELVRFNNALFRQASTAIAFQTGTSLPTEAYTDVEQQHAKATNGLVQITFIEEPNHNEEHGVNHRLTWQDMALDRLPVTLEKLQEHGVLLKDIAILVRKNEEGQRVAAHLLNYKGSDKARPGMHYDVVSNESLRIDGASTVNLLLAAMRYLVNAEDAIARAQLAFEYSRLQGYTRDLAEVFSVSNQLTFENNLPLSFSSQKALLKRLPLIELTETLINIFHLGNHTGELVYLLAFQDLVLEFSSRERNDLAAFLQWWEENRTRRSVQIAGEIDAVQILTIHKSKGLQFKYVIIPFCAWNLDHEPWQAPNLWVRSGIGVFADAGYLPVRYAKTLEQTCFGADYHEERTRSFVDNLNLLYVAMTRAEQGLFVTAPHPSVRFVKNTIAGLLHECLDRSPELKPGWKSDTEWFTGKWAPAEIGEGSHPEALSLQEYCSSPWREKLVIRQTSRTFFDDAPQERRERINYGIHMHAVLSRMKYADEVESMLETLVFEGFITSFEKADVKRNLEELFALTEVRSWFSHHWTVLTEVPLLLPGGAQSRLDRLIYRDKTAIVIDFKTGEKKRQDNHQVLQYIQSLRQMNFVDVRGFLLYLREGEVVEVKLEGRPKVLNKRKDRDQLSLGF